jgi:hypothetical protein
MLHGTTDDSVETKNKNKTFGKIISRKYFFRSKRGKTMIEDI